MINDKDIHPERKIYYLGALVIAILKEHKDASIDYISILQKLTENEKISANLFSLTLDWLFILGLIENKGGYIKKCF